MCPDYYPFYRSDLRVCTNTCPEEEPYHEEAGECYPRCPVWTFQVPGDSLCVAANPESPATSTVSFADTSYSYAYKLAPSYAVLDIAVQKIGAAFLETETVLASSRIRAVTKGAAYAPAVFFQAGTVLACELQLRASSPAGSGILGMVLLRSVRLSGCFLVANFEGEGTYPVAVKAC